MAAQSGEYFFGTKNGKEKAKVFIEDLEVRLIALALNPEQSERILKSDFRRGLRGAAETWYWNLAEEVHDGPGDDLKAVFLAEFGTATRQVTSIVEFSETVQEVRQAERPIAQYVRETKRVYEDCPEALQQMLGKQFLEGLDDRVKAREAL
ncbi:hypothetical protein MMC07_004449, partial [Pseudocyphellaria aurata]|nr:hypothetical protein [Pseudocyphellaria aurata]